MSSLASTASSLALPAAIDLHRLDEQAPAQRREGVEHGVDHAGLQLAEDVGRQSLAGQALILRAGDAVADHVRIGPDRVGAQLPQSGHPGHALAEVVFGVGERVAHVPAIPIGHELVEEPAIDNGVLARGLPNLFVVARQPCKVHGAADAVFRDQQTASRRC